MFLCSCVCLNVSVYSHFLKTKLKKKKLEVSLMTFKYFFKSRQGFPKLPVEKAHFQVKIKITDMPFRFAEYVPEDAV